MIAALNLDGFVDSIIGIYLQDKVSDEGANGTVDGSKFAEWVKRHMMLVLGDYRKKEKNSILIMDNVSLHMSREVVDIIKVTGCYLLYTVPYSPDLSPIEYVFNVYIKHT